MTTYYVEIRPAVRRSGPPKLVPLAEIHQYTGFRSAFCYDEELAKEIMAAGSTRFLRGQPVYTDTLFIDFDNVDSTEFREFLLMEGIGFERYDSGNRSAHYHIPLHPIYGEWVPNACKAWVKRHAPESDTSYLHPSGQYRLPNTYHPKNPGKCKILVEVYDGIKLDITASHAEKATFTPRAIVSGDQDPTEFYAMLTAPVGEGHRRPRCWLLSTMAAEIGLEFDDALELVNWWNSRFVDNPHPPSIIETQCLSAYERLQRDRFETG